jgi:hypothetical protein
MRSVILQFLTTAAAVGLGLPLKAQERLQTQGGGSIVLGGRTCAFTPLEALAGKPQGGIKSHILKLRGRLQPPQGGALDFDIQVTAQGQIYRMNLFQKEGDQEVERWAATLKTQVKVVHLEGREGGTVKLALSGPLSGVVRGQGRQEAWRGEIWYTLQSWPVP